MKGDETNPSSISLDSLADLFTTILNRQQPTTKNEITQPTTTQHTIETASSTAVNIKLTGKNNEIWSPVMEMFIGGKGRLDRITGQSPPPEPTDPTHQRWQQIDLAIKSWIVNSLNSTLVALFVCYPIAKAMWDAIAATYYDGADMMQLYELRRRTYRLRQNGEPLEKYYSTLQSMWREIDFRRPSPMECARDLEKHRQLIEEDRVF